MMEKRPLQPGLGVLAESIEIEAWTDFVRAAPPTAVEACGLALHDDAGAIAAVAANVDVFMFNRIVGLGIETDATEASLDSLLAAYRDAAGRRYFVQLSPAARPPELTEWLRDRGLARYNGWAKLIYRRDTTTPPRLAADLVVERIGPDRAGDFAGIVCAAFDWPPSILPWVGALVGRQRWSHYLAFADGEAVATGAVFIRDDVAWLGFAATAPSFRRRGAQSALIARRMGEALEAGCRTIVSETAEDLRDRPAPSFRNLRRLGFESLYIRPNYANVPAPVR